VVDGRGRLILTVTRACDLRCAYCPTAKDGWPALSPDDAVAAVRLFADRYGGGDVKLFGGEPLLVPEVVQAALDEAARQPRIRQIYLSTNGLGLNPARIEALARHEKLILTVSMDGRPEDHRRLRKGRGSVPDAYDHLVGLLPHLLALPRFVVTQTIAPSTAAQAAANFAHLVGLGIRRFNLLPGYYLPWKADQLDALDRGFAEIGAAFRADWAAGGRLYLRNLFTWAPTAFFNSGLVVDADRSIHPANVGLSGALEGLLGQTRVGDLDDPPSPEALAEAAARVPALLEGALSAEVLRSTAAVDRALGRLVEGLYPAWFAQRRARHSAGGAATKSGEPKSAATETTGIVGGRSPRSAL